MGQVIRRTWCTAVVATSSNTHFLSNLADLSRENRLLLWPTLLVVVSQMTPTLVQELLLQHWELSMMYAVLLNLETQIQNSRPHVFPPPPTLCSLAAPSTVLPAFFVTPSALPLFCPSQQVSFS
ncbi:hypothetical protein Pcinc_003160 [Petrolisthes cinctipes]|uniref:Uncharacterized protein n=1 Tax=Petrolisthes cinctipes TaxID=88211 RepID=A0AAE1GJF8_PETCI|nr:hypothetical protein Pcinc_003160 [Petrolisthes cinctipes]